MSLLTIVQNACMMIGIPRPVTVVNSTDQQVQQLYAFSNMEGYELSKATNWQALTRQYTFITTGDTSQPAAIPDDLERFIYNSFFDRTTRRQMIGPITPQQWQAIQAQPALSRVWLVWRERDGEFLITPTPNPDHTVAYEYVSKNWAKSSADVPKEWFTSDDDNTYLNEWLMTLGVIWRFKQAKGLPYSEDMQTYERRKQEMVGKDGGASALALGGTRNYLPWDSQAYTMDGNFPGPGS